MLIPGKGLTGWKRLGDYGEKYIFSLNDFADAAIEAP